jgi:homoserine/homoserine lactone efflux protein
MTLNTWLAFFVASWIISLSPGAGAISCMASGLRYGWRRGIWNILGLQLGITTALAFVALGIGALITASVWAFAAVKWFGVAYLVYLGIQKWRESPHTHIADAPGKQETSRLALFRQGFLVNVSNPKGLVFLLAVMPQFIDPHVPQVPQYAICGATLVFTDWVVMNGYTFFAARLLRLLREPGQIRWMNRTFGGLFVAAGGLLATFKRVI